MPVGADARVHQVEACRPARQLTDRAGVPRHRGLEVCVLDGHGVDAPLQSRDLGGEELLQARQVALGVARGRDALVDLEDVDCLPRDPATPKSSARVICTLST